MAILDIYTSIISYGDEETSTTSPKMKFVDWNRKVQNIPVSSPSSTQVTLEGVERRTLFSSVRLGPWVDELEYSILPLGKDSYALDAGPNVFREWLAAPSGLVKFEKTKSGALKVTLDGDNSWGEAMPGDYVKLQASKASAANRGIWQVASLSGASALLVPATGNKATGRSEEVEVEEDDIVAYSAAGVQVGDKILFGPEFPISSAEVEEVQDSAIVFSSVKPIALESIWMELSFYRSAKKYLRIEAAGEASVYINGSEQPLLISPLTLSSGDRLGWVEVAGTVFSVEVENLEQAPLTLNVISAE